MRREPCGNNSTNCTAPFSPAAFSVVLSWEENTLLCFRQLWLTHCTERGKSCILGKCCVHVKESEKRLQIHFKKKWRSWKCYHSSVLTMGMVLSFQQEMKPFQTLSLCNREEQHLSLFCSWFFCHTIFNLWVSYLPQRCAALGPLPNAQHRGCRISWCCSFCRWS